MRISDWSSDVCSSDLRATISRAIRAPNIFEAFRPSEGQTTNVEDPCAETNLGDNPNRAPNCAALGRPDGFTPLNGGVGVPFLVSGNVNLSLEESDSWTAGLVLTPHVLPDLRSTRLNPGTNAQIVSRLLLDITKQRNQQTI